MPCGGRHKPDLCASCHLIFTLEVNASVLGSGGCTSMTKVFNIARVGSLALQENKRRETGEEERGEEGERSGEKEKKAFMCS